MYVEMRQINKAFDGFQASRHVCIGVEKGRLAALLGPSGSGKTTILRMIAGLDRPDSGDIFLNGARVNDLPGSKRGIGFVFQNYALFRYMTVAENIAFGLKVQKRSRQEIQKRVEELLELISMEDFGKRYPYQLSGGQRQRCACARAIINNPRLLLADEPTGALDSHSSQMLLSTIQSINEQLRATILMVTHDAFTASYASRILFLKDGEIFMELRKGNDSRNAFFDKILNVLTIIGGGQSHVC